MYRAQFRIYNIITTKYREDLLLIECPYCGMQIDDYCGHFIGADNLGFVSTEFEDKVLKRIADYQKGLSRPLIV